MGAADLALLKIGVKFCAPLNMNSAMAIPITSPGILKENKTKTNIDR
jgi:hypothetical protein